MAETVTVMFTDLVGSTQLMERVGEVGAETLRRELFALTRTGVNKYGGQEVKNLGDGLMFVFASSSAAVAGSAEVQRALRARNTNSREPLLVRIGVSAGDVDHADDDYFGMAVIESARLCAVADGGQILVSDSVRALARGRSGFSFDSIGAIDLKGLTEPLAVFEVGWQTRSEGAGATLPSRLERRLAGAFVGRATEVDRVNRHVDDALSSGHQRIVIVSGEPGIGKSTLMAHAARRATENGALVALGNCEAEARGAFHPWRGVLGCLVERMSDDELRAHVSRTGSSLAVLVPSIAQRLDRPVPSTREDPEADRYALFAGAVDLLERASAATPLVVVIEDLQWADQSSLALLAHVVGTAEPMRMALLGTFRETDVSTRCPLAEFLADLRREDGVLRIDLAGLDDDAVLELIAALSTTDRAEPPWALRDALMSETAGNPFFVAEIVRHLTESGAIHALDDASGIAEADLIDRGVPNSLREVIVQRSNRLGDDAHQLLTIASVVGREFDLDLLAQISGFERDRLLDAAEAATIAGLVDNLFAGRFRFTHGLVGHALYEAMTPSRRSQIHQSIAEAMEVLPAGNDQDTAARLVHHWSAAATGNSRRIAVHACDAGDVALSHLAPEEALGWFEQARGLIADSSVPDDELRCRALIGCGESQWRTGDPSHTGTLASASRLAIELGSIDTVCSAATAAFGGMPTIEMPTAERLEILESAYLATSGERSERRATITSCLAGALILMDAPRSLELANEAITLARQLGDEHALAWAVVRGSWSSNAPRTIDAFDALVDEALSLSSVVADPVLTWHAESIGVHRACRSGDIDGMLRHTAATSSIASQLGHPLLMFVATQQQAVSSIILGRLSEAESHAREAFAIASAAGLPDGLATYAAQITTIRLMQGTVEEVVDVLARVAGDAPNVPAYRAALSLAYASLGRVDDAADTLANDIADGFVGFPMDPAWPVAMHMCAEAVALMDLAEPAETLVSIIRPHAQIVARSGPTCFEVLHHSVGELLTTVGRYDEAEEQLRSAEAVHSAMRAPFFLARTRLSLAELAIRRDQPGDRGRATDLLDQLRSACRQHGYSYLLTRADSLGSRVPPAARA